MKHGLTSACSFALLMSLGLTHGQGVSISGPAGTYTSTVVLAAAGPVTMQSPFSGPAGTYTLTLPAGATITQTATSITITWGPGPGPNPTPVPPTPSPPTIPSGSVPVATKLWLAMISDPTTTLTPAQQALSTSSTIGQSLAAATANASWKTATSASLSAELATWAADVKAVGLPALLAIAVDSTGHATVHEVIKPVDEASVMSEVKRIRGN